MKNVLVLGGTGAMGRYLVPELLNLGYHVDSVSIDRADEDLGNLRYILMDAMDDGNVDRLLNRGYDAIVDFMSYSVPQFRSRMPIVLGNTDQYIFLSSCRVYANEDPVVKETSPKLLDVSTDMEYLSRKETEYSLYKAMEENMILDSGKKNWTIVRPATTYSTGRSQLVTLEANSFVYRAMKGKKVCSPEAALSCPATLTWGGDVGKMLAHLVLKPEAYGEDFITATSEYHTWGEIAEFYRDLIGLDYEAVDIESYLRCIADENRYPYARYQLIYARMFNRITDNSKILKFTGLKQEDMTSLYDGLKTELARVTLDNLPPDLAIDRRMDAFFAGR